MAKPRLDDSDRKGHIMQTYLLLFFKGVHDLLTVRCTEAPDEDGVKAQVQKSLSEFPEAVRCEIRHEGRKLCVLTPPDSSLDTPREPRART